MRLRRGHKGGVAARRRADASAGCLRTMAASPCASMPQQRAELTRHTGEFHAPVHGKKSEPHPLASKPAIKKSRTNCAAKPRRGRVAAESTRAPSSSSMALLSEKKSSAKTGPLAVCGISNKNKMDRSFLYICAPLRPAAPLLGPRFLGPRACFMYVVLRFRDLVNL